MSSDSKIREKSFTLILKILIFLPISIVAFPNILYAVDVANVAELRQEITDINNGQADNVINLTSPTFTVMEEDPIDQNLNAFPEITSEIIIRKDLNLQGNVVIVRDSVDDFRFFRVDSGGDLTLSDVTLNNGLVNGFGGAIQVRGESSLTLENVIIINCEAFDSGGAIDIVNSSLNIENSQIGRIDMPNEADDNGGGINIDGNSPVSINNSVIAGNIAEGGGGIINMSNNTVSITNSIIENNNADTTNGGGISNIGGTLILTNSTIRMNEANNTGGGIFNDDATITITGSTVGPGNTAEAGGGGGGGITNNTNGVMVISNTTVSDNDSSSVGGGIVNFNSDLTMNNVTIGFNESVNEGGGIWNFGNDINITNTLIGQNMAGADGDECFSNVSITTDNSNLVFNEASFCMLDGPAITGLSPQLGSLALNNNPNNTLTNAIPMMSPAFNAGNNNTCEQIDQRDIPRPQGESCDIGAYELEVDGGGGNEFAPGDANGDGSVNVLDIAPILNEFFGIGNVVGNGDCNQDGATNTIDISCVLNIFFGN